MQFDIKREQYLKIFWKLKEIIHYGEVIVVSNGNLLVNARN